MINGCKQQIILSFYYLFNIKQRSNIINSMGDCHAADMIVGAMMANDLKIESGKKNGKLISPSENL